MLRKRGRDEQVSEAGCLTRSGPQSRRQGQKLKVPVGDGRSRGQSRLGGMAVGLGGWKARAPPVQGRAVEGPASGAERRPRAGRGAGILWWGGGAAGCTVAALEKGCPQAKPRGLGAEDLEPSRAWKDQAGRIWWLKGWIPGSGLQREGKAQEQELLLEGSEGKAQEQELLLEGSGPPRVRGPHGALGRDVLGLNSARGG